MYRAGRVRPSQPVPDVGLSSGWLARQMSILISAGFVEVRVRCFAAQVQLDERGEERCFYFLGCRAENHSC
jgi:hypothetical protein